MVWNSAFRYAWGNFCSRAADVFNALEAAGPRVGVRMDGHPQAHRGVLNQNRDARERGLVVEAAALEDRAELRPVPVAPAHADFDLAAVPREAGTTV